MLSPHIYVALVHERHQAFLAQAETDRRKRRARPRRQRGGAGATATGRPVVLDRKSKRLNSSHLRTSRMPSSA